LSVESFYNVTLFVRLGGWYETCYSKLDRFHFYILYDGENAALASLVFPRFFSMAVNVELWQDMFLHCFALTYQNKLSNFQLLFIS